MSSKARVVYVKCVGVAQDQENLEAFASFISHKTLLEKLCCSCSMPSLSGTR